MKEWKLDDVFTSIDKTIRSAFTSIDADIREAFSSIDKDLRVDFASIDKDFAATPGVEIIREEETRPDGTRIVRTIRRQVQK